MKVAIIADIHDNVANLNIFLKMAKVEKIDKTICLGDITNEETLKKLAHGFKEEIFLVYGNTEIYSESSLENYKNINYFGRFGTFQLDNLKIGICHEPGLMRNLFQANSNLDFIFYGHTHKPWISIKNKANLINPGTLGGVFQKPSFAIFNTETRKIKLKLLH
ncbi:MAG: YfcE family phosphodiesterase [Patescibacteria group bacterium]|nr:YfcE family phosphodiesterase [Patescibacteria group bacterium]